ncbi:MAG: hypothetical protein KTR31_22085 [Myxococcales bacterium]|nr:hypothetical protein [Myxococcales bacterium]
MRQGSVSLENLREVGRSALLARVAAESARRAANVLMLEHDLDAARRSWEWIRSARERCEAATAEVDEHLQHSLPQDPTVVDGSLGRGLAAASRAIRSAEEAEALVTTLDDERRSGRLSARGCAVALEHARVAAEEARGEAERATTQHHPEGVEAAARLAVEALHRCQAIVDRALAIEARAVERTTAEARHAFHQVNLLLRQARATHERSTILATQRQHAALDEALHDSAEGLRACRSAATFAMRLAQDALQHSDSQVAMGRVASCEALVSRARSSTGAVADAAERIALLVRQQGTGADPGSSVQEAEALLVEATGATQRARAEVRELLAQTEQLSDETVEGERAKAERSVCQAEASLGHLEGLVHTVRVTVHAAAARRRMPELRGTASRVVGAAAGARLAAIKAWGAADPALAERAGEELRRACVAGVAREANAHASTARSLVAEAREETRQVAEALKRSTHVDARRLRDRALALLEAAEFRTADADSAAASIALQDHPSHARTHAADAASHLERIAQDVTEARRTMRYAAELASRLEEASSQARSTAAEARQRIEELQGLAVDGLRDARQHVAQGSPELDAQLERLQHFVDALGDEGHAAEELARVSAAQLDEDAAVELMTTGQTLLARCASLRVALDEQLAQLATAVGKHHAERQLVADAVIAIQVATQAAESELGSARDAASRLCDEARERDAATAATTEQNALTDMVDQLEHIASSLQQLRQIAAQTSAAEEASRMASEAELLREQAARAASAVIRVEGAGMAAIERHVQARQDAERQQQETRRRRVEEARATVRARLTSVEGSLAEAESTVLGSDSEVAKLRFRRLARNVAARLDELTKAMAQDDAEALEFLATQATSWEREVEQQIASCLEQTRTGDTERLERARTEIAADMARCERGLVELREASQQLMEAMRGASAEEMRTSSDEAIRISDVAEAAHRELQDAVSKASGDDELASVEHLLQHGRRQLARVRGAATDMTTLARAVARRVLKQSQHDRRAVAQTSQLGLEPLQTVARAASEATSWLQSGREEAEGSHSSPNARAAMDDLQDSVHQIRHGATRARRLSRQAQLAKSPSAAQQAVEVMREVSEQAMQTSARARKALDRLRRLLRRARLAHEQLGPLRADAKRSADKAAEITREANRGLRQLLDSLGPHPTSRPVSIPLQQSRLAVRASRHAAHRAAEAHERARSSRNPADALAACELARAALRGARGAAEEAQVWLRIAGEAVAHDGRTGGRFHPRMVEALPDVSVEIVPIRET